MTCADVSQVLDAFVDAELSAPMLLAVARHAGACAVCDGAVRSLTALHEAIERTVQEEAAALDLSGVWPAVEPGLARVDAARAWRRRLRAMPAWGAAMAAAAGAVLWLRPSAPPAPARVAVRPNHAIIERLDTGGARRLELRRARKDGTTLIMWSADAAGMPR